MEPVEEIIYLEGELQRLAARRAALAGNAREQDQIDTACRVIEGEIRDLQALLTPEDEQWLDVERAKGRHGVD